MHILCSFQSTTTVSCYTRTVKLFFTEHNQKMIRFEWLPTKIKISNRIIFSDYEARLKKQVRHLNFTEDWSVAIRYVTFHVSQNKDVAIKFVCVKIPGVSHSGKVKWT